MSQMPFDSSETKQSRTSRWLSSLKGTIGRRQPSPLPEGKSSPSEIGQQIRSYHNTHINLDHKSGSNHETAALPTLTEPSLTEGAYSQSVRKLSQQDHDLLRDDTNIQAVITTLESARSKQLDKSGFEKTRIVLAPWLAPAKNAFGLAGDLLSGEPVTATVLSLIKGTIGFAVTFCEIADKIDDKIKHFCRLAPILAEFDMERSGRNPAINDLLEQLFDAMLAFHLEVMSKAKRSNSLGLYIKEVFTGKISNTISLFNNILESLQAAMLVHTNMLAQKLSVKQDTEETTRLIQELLAGQEAETLLRNGLDEREDEACEWIIKKPEYQRWHSPSEVQCLVLLDNSGFGKSVSTAYMTTYLVQNGKLVCSYHLNQGISTPEVVYRGLLHQILTECSSLLPQYLHWRESKLKNKSIAVCSRKELREFLVDCLSTTGTVSYLILDGFDECLPSCQRELYQLFAELYKSEASVKLFISTGSSLNHRSLSYHSKLEMAMDKSKRKDLLIAVYWTQKCLDDTDPSLQTLIATYLAEQAQGSCLWIKLAAEYLNRFKVYSESDFQEARALLPSSEEILKTYTELMEKVTDKIPVNREQLQRALDLLAVAERAMTIAELHSAVQLSLRPLFFTDIADLAKVDNRIKLQRLLEPFVTRTQDNKLRLFHHSLRAFLLQSLPGQSQGQEEHSFESSTAQTRKEVMNRYMYLACTKYLLLSGQQNPEIHEDDPFRYIDMDLSDQESTSGGLQSSGTSSREQSTKDDSQAFFSYAARHWLSHLSLLNDADAIDYSDIIGLCRQESSLTESRHKTWYKEFLYAGNWSHFRHGIDPLQAVARFGCSAVVLRMASLYSPTMALIYNSISDTITTLMDRGMTKTILELMESTQYIGTCFRQIWMFNTISHSWPEDDVDTPCPKDSDWNMILGYLIQQLREDLLQKANDTLRVAAQRGCLPIIEKLFEAAETDTELRSALLQPHKKHTEHSYVNEHQSVGEAVYYGHKNTIKFLCNQEGIDSHIRYVNHYGRTVFHQAERCSDFEIVSILHQRWPEGIVKLDDNKDSLLHLLCFRAGEFSIPVLIKDLIGNNLITCDIRGSDGESPLLVAVRGANLELCQYLVKHGADIEDVIEINQDNQYELKEYSEGGKRILAGLGQLYQEKSIPKPVPVQDT